MSTIIANQIITTPLTLTSTGSGDAVYVSEGSVLTNVRLEGFTGVDPIYIIMGELFNANTILDFYSSIPGDIPSLYVGPNGSLTSANFMYQGNSLALFNQGEILAFASLAISVYGDGDNYNFYLENSGQITATGTGPNPGFYTIDAQYGGTILNSGTITSPTQAIFLGFDATHGTFGDLTNTGTINGDVTFGGGDDIILNTGSVFGDVDLGAGIDNTRNTGSFFGAVQLGDGNDHFDSRGGQVIGTVMAGEGNDTVYGGVTDDTITGGSGSDKIRGFDGDDSLNGEGSADNISGGAGDDTIDGGASSDFLVGGLGHDSIIGGGGNDTIHGSDGNDSVLGMDGADSVKGGAGDDILQGDGGNDMLHGGAGDDNLDGGANNDNLSGGSGNDYVLGALGNDALNGNAGDDTLDGQNGNDVLNGGWGNDTLTGGVDADSFVFITRAGDDIVTDFQDGIDMIDMSPFQLANFAALSGAISDYNGGALIDLNALGGDGSVWVQGTAAASLTAADFIL